LDLTFIILIRLIIITKFLLNRLSFINNDVFQLSQVYFIKIFMLQWNCCGAFGPRDYHDSFWFNHTTFDDGPFVPQSCCVLVHDSSSRQPRFKDEVQCQIEAIILNSNRTDSRHSENVQTQVRSCKRKPDE